MKLLGSLIILSSCLLNITVVQAKSWGPSNRCDELSLKNDYQIGDVVTYAQQKVRLYENNYAKYQLVRITERIMTTLEFEHNLLCGEVKHHFNFGVMNDLYCEDLSKNTFVDFIILYDELGFAESLYLESKPELLELSSFMMREICPSKAKHHPVVIYDVAYAIWKYWASLNAISID
ncbi:MAG: hypothetical protein A2381_14880 [Bdellovibrionales bacterium RIFOXYB1_FULL_37_110]|nr:MAG: hypothetical protein A2417_10385 [Bdellovibrionales bacterium RIFOXYC1_FULL_37_79]OFZ60149.1 MAG: hypothetical protein A2381_14880 [Bdellovibrionales bacterium RIFOXYB1_FULL_37_110]OFZ64357.1 MAG: hypothetical protein A2577_09890 [Bdellovibrionales bacterium RIFOXYD1_FULL_36_51]